MDADRKEFLFQVFIVFSLFIVSGIVLIFSYYQSRAAYDYAKCVKEELQEVYKYQTMD